MRNMSFSLTAPQILCGVKTVTRRLGWDNLRCGEFIRPVAKVRGLKRGETVQALRDPLRVVSVRRERLDRLLTERDCGIHECRREGYADHPLYREPEQFVAHYCRTHPPCRPETLVTRIEFEYVASPEPQYSSPTVRPIPGRDKRSL
jgi:hypothetical protein